MKYRRVFRNYPVYMCRKRRIFSPPEPKWRQLIRDPDPTPPVQFDRQMLRCIPAAIRIRFLVRTGIEEVYLIYRRYLHQLVLFAIPSGGSFLTCYLNANLRRARQFWSLRGGKWGTICDVDARGQPPGG